jgi:hypothetical protein
MLGAVLAIQSQGRRLLAEVKITRTTALFPTAVFVQWDVGSDESGAFFVDIARAEGPDGPWESIATGLRDAYNFIDNQFNLPPADPKNTGREGVNLFSLARVVYYQVSVTPPSGSANTFTSDPTPVEPGLDRRTRLFKRKILHDQAVGYRRLNGIPLIVLKRKRWGDRCPQCYDPVTKESTLEHCMTCFGTTFVGGYWAPTLIRGRREAAAVETRITAHGDSDIRFNDFNILDYPLVEYKDLIIDLVRNERYQVQRTHHTELKSVTVHQKLTTSLLGHNAIEYKLLVDPTATPPLY